ncbi:MAG TPA: hypothetical protein VF056_04510 [Thermoleophilaceae bacterium]
MLEIDTKTGARSEAVPAQEHAAIGLKYDKHADRLFVSGGPTGKAFVYDASSGVELASFQLTAAGEPTFINDVVLTRDTAYFTDSLQPVIYALKRDLSGVTPIPLSGFPMTAGQNNLNGIDDFDVPTTFARQRGSLYLPSARFRTPPTPPESEYWVTRVSKP